MTIKKGQILELEISDMAYGGKGVARIDGFTVFVEHTAAFDIVKARITKKKKNYAEAYLVELIKPSPFRVNPPCIYSGHCGGCKWQFLQYEQQIVCKQQHVSDSLEHIAMIRDVPVHATIPSPLIFGYRNKMEFTCADRKWLMPCDMGNIDTGFALGLHVPGIFHKVIDIDACFLHPKLGNQILNDVKAVIKNSDIPVYGLVSHTGFWRFLMLRHSSAYDQWMVNIITAAENRKYLQPAADMLMEKYPQIVSIMNNITSRRAGIAVGEYEINLAGASKIKDKIGQFEFEISANSFFQTNTRGAETLYKIVKNFASLTGIETVLDLYCGTGSIAIYLSDLAKQVIGMEIVESSIADAQNNCLLNGISNCRFIGGDIKDSLSQITQKPDVIIIDPPRTGMHTDVVKKILEMAPPRIVYVSCNPATLARDLGLLKEKYRILEVQPVDMFPHTYHIEAVARLEKKEIT